MKTTWIYFLMFGLLLSSLLFSCGKEDVDKPNTHIYIYHNKTPEQITVIKYLRQESDTFFISPQKSLKFSQELNFGSCMVNNEIHQPLSICSLLSADSVWILKNNIPFVRYLEADTSSKNLLKQSNYVYSESGNTDTYTYTFN